MSSGPIKVLLVDDDAADAERLADVVSRHAAAFEIIHAGQLSEALHRLAHDRFDAVLLDATLCGSSGLEALVRLNDQALDVPIIVLTDREDEALSVAALKHGAQDSLVKSEVEGNLLLRSVRYAIERNQLRMAVRAMALVDELTGLYNRRGFLTLARQQLKMADRLGKRMSQVFVDLDGLKWINDTFGHPEGDRALIETADLLRDTFRESDIVARIGGDEFVVLAFETPGMSAELFGARLTIALAARNARPERRYPLALSMGVASYDPAIPCAIDDLLERADQLMYADKHGKRRPA